MAATLEPGELVLVDRVSPLLGLQRGEVVVFRPPIPGYSGIPFVKRVIGLPGDRLDLRGGRVYVNGRALSEPYVYGGQPTDTGFADVALTVPPGSIFVMGDHRGDSWDSRSYGPVPIADVVGRAWLAAGPRLSVALLPSPDYGRPASPAR